MINDTANDRLDFGNTTILRNLRSRPRGEDPVSRRVGPGDFLATLYRHLGIDFHDLALQNLAGRPIPLLANGEPIRELAG